MSVKGVTGVNSGTEGMCTVAERGLQCVQGVCTGADRGCTGVTMKTQGVTEEDSGFSYGHGISEPAVV